MPLTDSQVRSLPPGTKRQKKSCGDSLYVVVEPISKGGGKSFIGITRFPPRSPNNGGVSEQSRAPRTAHRMVALPQVSEA
jgi:hypothetical protein